MTKEQFIRIQLIPALQAFNKKGKIANNDINGHTIIDDIVGENDIYPGVNTKGVFKNFIKWSIAVNLGKQAKKTWPKDWEKLSVSDLVDKIIMILVFVFSSFAASSQTQVSVSTIKTDSKNTALNVVFKSAIVLDSIWKNSDYFIAGKRSFFAIAPSVNMQAGTQDAFSSIEAKATGMLTTFKVKEIEGIKAPDLTRTFHVIPFSIGVESDNTFNKINGIVEAGWIPWYYSETSNTPEFLKRSKLGVFMQAGRKFYRDSTNESEILRARGNFTIDTRRLFNAQSFNVGLVGSADVWYDFLRRDAYYKNFYYRLQGTIRFYVTESVFFDLDYQKGSGAPNFFTGDQFGAGATISF